MTPASELEIRRLEKEIGLRLPESYRQFLRSDHSGFQEPAIYPLASGRQLYVGLLFGSDVSLLRDAWYLVEDSDEQLIPIGTNTGGDYFLLRVPTGAIYLWLHEEHDLPPTTSEMVLLEPDIDSMLRKLTRVDPNELSAGEVTWMDPSILEDDDD